MSYATLYCIFTKRKLDVCLNIFLCVQKLIFFQQINLIIAEIVRRIKIFAL